MMTASTKSVMRNILHPFPISSAPKSPPNHTRSPPGMMDVIGMSMKENVFISHIFPGKSHSVHMSMNPPNAVTVIPMMTIASETGLDIERKIKIKKNYSDSICFLKFSSIACHHAICSSSELISSASKISVTFTHALVSSNVISMTRPASRKYSFISPSV